MKSFFYLYGDNDPRKLHQMNYLEALHTKVLWATERRNQLNNVNWRWRPMVNVTDCIRAIEHNNKLIEEYKHV